MTRWPDEIMGAFEIQTRLGVSRQRAYIIIGRRDFPAPRWELAMGKVWDARDVEAWIAENRPELNETVEGAEGGD